MKSQLTVAALIFGDKNKAKKYNFKKYSQMCESPLSDDMTGHVTVQILDKKIDTLFRLTWL